MDAAAIGKCRESLLRGRLDVIVVDLDGQTDDGLQWLAELNRLRPQVPQLALVDRRDIPTAMKAIRAGASNCIEKPTESERLLRTIHKLLSSHAPKHVESRPHLTRTETVVLRLVLEGKTTREIAQVLHRSPRTIEVHRRNIMHNLGASSLAGLVREAARLGLLDSCDKR